ncbi:hypothetical protein [Bradyrhizobium sp. ORS 111]|uniref:hypothetical protein n=1 Tax=Bradyrhizobium sp. ORS 111 TaxID=1685958 RepID=UPI00388D214B
MAKLGVATAALFLLYFPLAIWVTRSHVNVIPDGEIVVQLVGPFETYNHANISHQKKLDQLSKWADDEAADPQKSPIVVYENTVPLGPSHSSFEDIAKKGAGRYAYWRNGLTFSTSDNSNPGSNGRTYWAVLPKHEPNGAQ